MQFFDTLPGRSYPARRRQIDWKARRADLESNPGKWGLVAENVSASVIDQIRNGRVAAIRGDDLKHFEFSTRRPENPTPEYGARRTDLYGKYEPKAGQ